MPKLERITVLFSDGKVQKTVLHDLSLDIPEGKLTAVMGASGRGKTTLLRLLAGLIPPTSGNVTRETSSISYAFQDPSLLPWLTAEQNVNMVLGDRKETLPLAREWLARVGLAAEAQALPAALSGGMQQRVALARALAADADLLLLDEPFRGLDEALHAEMLDLVATVRRGKTTVLVTHDAGDLRVADHVVDLDQI